VTIAGYGPREPARAVQAPDEMTERTLFDANADALAAGDGVEADQPSRWLPLLSWRDYPALLQHQRLLRDVAQAAAAARDALQRALDDRGSVAGEHERALLTTLRTRMDETEAAAVASGDDLYRYRIAAITG
jgi:hypothetical protein